MPVAAAAAGEAAAAQEGLATCSMCSLPCAIYTVACCGLGGTALCYCQKLRKQPFEKAQRQRLEKCAGVGAQDCDRPVEVFCHECREAYCRSCLQPAHSRSVTLRRHCDFMDLKAPDGRRRVQSPQPDGTGELTREEYAELLSLLQSERDPQSDVASTAADESIVAPGSHDGQRQPPRPRSVTSAATSQE
eukprot:TRINITY_DN37764_c0_g1_i1.p1 TRINITY_DN37764_c0_g1~~TRINITY_DN37764_c0_g1_i1.p1  ORF type:complete len:206 (+),score=40.77 TRINITY_DN37764_c0_g1_i1:51-620(+)